MAVREIRLFGDPVLRTVAEPVREFDAGLHALVRDLMETLDAPGRVGLAAPQIGVGLRVFAYDVDGTRGHLVNPLIVAAEGEQVDDEGCLSIPGLWYPTPRPERVVAAGYTAAGEPTEITGTGLLARCLSHEIDHLDGILYIDRLDREHRRAAMRAIREAAWGR